MNGSHPPVNYQFLGPEEARPTGNRIFSVKLLLNFICQFPCPKCMSQDMLQFYSETSYYTAVSHFKFRCSICSTEFTLNDSSVVDEPHKQRMISRNKFLVVANALASNIGLKETNTQLLNMEIPAIGSDVWRRCARMWQKKLEEQEQEETKDDHENRGTEKQLQKNTINKFNINITEHNKQSISSSRKHSVKQIQSSQPPELNLTTPQSHRDKCGSPQPLLHPKKQPSILTKDTESVVETLYSKSSFPTGDGVNSSVCLSQKQHDNIVCIPDIDTAQITTQIKNDDHETTDGQSYLSFNKNVVTAYREIARREAEEDVKQVKEGEINQSDAQIEVENRTTKTQNTVKQEVKNVETPRENISAVSDTHIDTLHAKSALKQYEPPSMNNTIYECPECDYTCTLSYYLKIHMKTCVVKKLYDCLECDYKCSKRSEMEIHMMNHKGEEPYSCSECGYKCVHPFYLKRHMRTHTGEKPFACTFCKYKFSQKCHLKRHMRTHI